MGDLEQSKVFDTSVAIWEDLLSMRDAFSNNGTGTEDFDLAIGLPFLPEEHNKLGRALGRAKELMAVASQMKEWGADCIDVNFAISSVFKPGKEDVYGEELSRWHILKDMRDRLKARHMNTTSIDNLLSGLFLVSC